VERSKNLTVLDFDGGQSAPAGGSENALDKRITGQARARMGELALLMFTVTVLFLPLFGFVLFRFEVPALTWELVLIGLTGISLDAALFFAARDPSIADATVVRFGLVYQVLRVAVAGLSAARLGMPLGLPPNAVTIGHGLIILFALFVPLAPHRRMLVAVLAAATQPFVLWAFAPHAVPVASLVNSCIASCLSAIVATSCGRVTFALGTRAARGDELGAYHLAELLRRERLGEVWRGTHRLLARPAAIRIIRPPLVRRSAGREALARFEEQARTAASLTSPHTVTLYDYGVSEDGALYAAFELLDGESLGGRVARAGPLPVAEAGRIVLEVCDSLEEAHAAGLAHGELSPRNVFLCHLGCQQEFTKVVELGMSRIERQLQQSAGVRAPEDGSRLLPDDAASDIHQLGRLLAFMLTGNEQADIRALRERGVPAALRQVVARSTTARSTASYQSVSALRAALRLALGGQPLPELTEPDRSQPEPPSSESSSVPSSGSRRDAVFTRKALRHRVMKTPRHATPEMIEVARPQLQQLALVIAALVAVFFIGALLVSPQWRAARVLEELVPTVAIALSLDLAIYFMARDRRLSTGALMKFALGYFVLEASVLSFASVRASLLFGREPPLVTFAQLLILVVPLFVPKRPKELFLPLLLIAAATPVALYLFTPPEYPPAWPAAAVRSAANLFIAVFAAHFVSGLHLSASRERAFGSYRLVERVGRGGVGEVWKAEHELLARPAAIKLVSMTNLTRRGLAVRERRFAREARTTALLSSPHTVTLYDYGVSDDGRFYAVMELLQGEDLQRAVERNGPFSARSTVAIALQVCDSLAEAHARGLVHRDLKPANIFMAKIGGDPQFIKVLDFGFAELANKLSDDASTVATARIVGTPAYMSPEVFLQHTVDRRADIYQLGCVLFFLLTGHSVFERDSFPALALAHVNTEPEPASLQAPSPVPVDLERIIARCLRKDPNERFGEIAELEVALHAVRFDHLQSTRRGHGASHDRAGAPGG
jgi:serine/threonine-protein kinase